MASLEHWLEYGGALTLTNFIEELVALLQIRFADLEDAKLHSLHPDLY